MAAFAQSPPPPLHTTAHGPHALPHHPQLQPQHLHNHQLHTPPSVVTHSPALTSSAPAPRNMPKVGETRCYWALLDDRLEFLFLDPVLGHHLEDQKDALLGRSLLEFVHPDELASARQDLQGMLDSRTLHGSVTRVRFSRLSSIRRRLGFQGIPVIPQFMEQGGVFFDNEYMPVNLVINVASDGLILCFIHAVVDIKPTEDNDEQKRNCWTNWCGTQAGGLSHENSTALRHTLSQRNMPHSELPHGRVFQILRHVPGRPCIFSWPSDLPNNDFAQLANRIEMEVPGFTDSSTSSAGGTPATATSAKTSCTRRYKSEMNIPCSDQLERDIESIFVPYGCIIFACHRTKSARRIPQPAMYPQPVPYPYEHPAAFASGPPASAFGQWNGNNTAGASGSWPGYDGPPEASAHRHNSFDSARSPSESTSSSARNSQTLPEPPLGRQSPSGGDSGGDEGAERRRSRVGGAPPQGVTRCSNCKIKQSPEWRKGPSGKKDLCNACGLRFARSRAKKEGTTANKKSKKEKEPSTGGGGASRGSRKNSAASTMSAAGGNFGRDYDYADAEGTSAADAASSPPQPLAFAPAPLPPPAPQHHQQPQQMQQQASYDARIPTPQQQQQQPQPSPQQYYQGLHPGQHPMYAQQQYAHGGNMAAHNAAHHAALSMLSRAASVEQHHQQAHEHHAAMRAHDRSPGPVYVR